MMIPEAGRQFAADVLLLWVTRRHIALHFLVMGHALIVITQPTIVHNKKVVAARFQRDGETQKTADRHVGNVPPQPFQTAFKLDFCTLHLASSFHARVFMVLVRLQRPLWGCNSCGAVHGKILIGSVA